MFSGIKSTYMYVHTGYEKANRALDTVNRALGLFLSKNLTSQAELSMPCRNMAGYCLHRRPS